MPEAFTPRAPIIEVHKLTKKYGTTPALRGIDLSVGDGEFLAVFGPNGAGKSTLIKVLATLSRPTSGTVRVAGMDVAKKPVEVRRLIGLVPHQTLVYDDLSVYENLSFYARMYGVQDVAGRIGYLVQQIGLEPYSQSRVRGLSRGTQQRLSIARALLHNPRILLLDEAETGLDQRAIDLFKRLITGGAPRTVVMATHRLEQGLAMAGRIVILARGRVTYDGATDGLRPDQLVDIYCRCTGASQ